MAKALLPAALLLLLLLIACSEPTSTVVIEPTLTPQQEATTPVPAQPGPTLPTETSATATPRPTESPATALPPRPTETPTTIPEPTATPAPTEDEPPASQLTPLLLDDPEAVASELSDRELACLAGVADPERLLTIFSDPGLATADEQTKVIQCFHDETVARLFLTAASSWMQGPSARRLRPASAPASEKSTSARSCSPDCRETREPPCPAAWPRCS